MIQYAEFARYWIVSSKPIFCPTGTILLRLNVIIPCQICLLSLKILQRPFPNMMPQDAQKYLLLVGAGCHLFAEVNVTVLWPLGAKILWPSEQVELARLVQNIVRFLQFPRQCFSTFFQEDWSSKAQRERQTVSAAFTTCLPSFRKFWIAGNARSFQGIYMYLNQPCTCVLSQWFMIKRISLFGMRNSLADQICQVSHEIRNHCIRHCVRCRIRPSRGSTPPKLCFLFKSRNVVRIGTYLRPRMRLWIWEHLKAFQQTFTESRPGEWRSGQCAQPGILKVLVSNPAFSTKHVTCLLQLNEAKSSFTESRENCGKSWEKRYQISTQILWYHI